jgi:hypothetical protein
MPSSRRTSSEDLRKENPSPRSAAPPPHRQGGGGKVAAAQLDLDDLLADPAVAEVISKRGWTTRRARPVAEGWQKFWAGGEKGNPAKPRATWTRILAEWLARDSVRAPELPRAVVNCPKGLHWVREGGPPCRQCEYDEDVERVQASILRQWQEVAAAGDLRLPREGEGPGAHEWARFINGLRCGHGKDPLPIRDLVRPEDTIVGRLRRRAEECAA